MPRKEATATTIVPPTEGATPSAEELAEHAVVQQQRLVAAARERATAASAARAVAETALANAEQDRDRLRVQSATSRDNPEASAGYTHACVLLEHASADRDAASRAEREAGVEVQRAEARLVEAQNAVERGRIERKLADYSEAAHQHVAAIVAAVLGARSSVQALRDLLREDAEAVARFHSVGGSVDVRPRDGSTAGGHLAAALLALGAQPASGNLHSIRWLFDRPQFEWQDPSSNERTVQVMSYIAQALEIGRVRTPGAGDAALKAIADVWTKCRTAAEATEVAAERERTQGAVVAEGYRVAHEKRLAAAATRPARDGRGPVRRDGTGGPQPAVQPMARPALRAPAAPPPHPAYAGDGSRIEGEFEIGADGSEVPVS